MAKQETVVLGGGCFWCLEAVYDQMDGVVSVESGYMGGHVSEPSYREVCEGTTGHAEVVRLTFDPDVTPFREILGVFFALNRGAFQIIGIDLSEYATFRGAVLDLDGQILHRAELPLAGATGADATALVTALADTLVAAATLPVLGMGVGSPGVVDLAGVVLSAPNLGWVDEPLQQAMSARFGVPVVVANDANVAALAEHSFGGADSDMMLIKVGHGVGAGLLLDGTPLFGSRFAAGEIGHVVVGTDGGAECVCGKHGCLETWLAVPRLEKAIAAAPDERTSILQQAGQRLGIALAPVVGALNLAEVVLSGPTSLLDGPLAQATIDTLRNRTMAEFHGDLTLRMTTLGEDIVMRGAAVMVLSAQLGVS